MTRLEEIKARLEAARVASSPSCVLLNREFAEHAISDFSWCLRRIERLEGIMAGIRRQIIEAGLAEEE